MVVLTLTSFFYITRRGGIFEGEVLNKFFYTSSSESLSSDLSEIIVWELGVVVVLLLLLLPTALSSILDQLFSAQALADKGFTDI